MDRKSTINALKGEVFDVLIVGAGINGAVSAASLSHHNYRVALIDQGDFASHTSQASSNLIWGGIKYLENYEFSLVNQLCRSRNQLMKAFPTLIKEIRFLMPISSRIKSPKPASKNWKRHPFIIYAGMWFYWLLGRFQTQAPKRYRLTDLASARYPLNPSLFTGALEYSDAFLPENDSRLVYWFIQRAENNDAVVANYVRLKQKKSEEQESQSFVVEDSKTKKSFTVRARFLINAAGPFIDGINQGLSLTTEHQHVFSKGIHLIFPKIFSDEKVISFFDEDNRLFFAIPMGPRTVVGTTDTMVDKPTAQVTDTDRDFLLRNINNFLSPEKALSRKDIIAERCGVRPLVVKKSSTSSENNWFQLSRKHSLEVNGAALSVFGGKLTDCLNIGEEIADVVGGCLSKNKKKLAGNSEAANHQVWYGEEGEQAYRDFLKAGEERLTLFPDLQKFLPLWWSRYGSKAKEVLNILAKQKGIKEIYDSGYTDAELVYIVKNEQVVKMEDLLRRRTKLEQIIKKSKLLKHPVIKRLIKDCSL